MLERTARGFRILHKINSSSTLRSFWNSLTSPGLIRDRAGETEQLSPAPGSPADPGPRLETPTELLAAGPAQARLRGGGHR